MKSLKLAKLQLKNFRNLEEAIISFGPGINCIFGQNGNGKTNILEALYFIVHRKSFRKNTSFPQLLSIDGDNPEIYFSSIFIDDEESNLISYSGKYGEKKSEWFLDQKPSKKKLNIGIVFINPFDSYGFHNTPGHRRTWVDQHLSQLDGLYKSTLKKFNNALKFRNTLLGKKPPRYKEQIQASDDEFCRLSVQLTAMRVEFLKDLERFISPTFKEIFSEEHDLKITLDTKLTSGDPQQLKNILLENFQKDEIIGHTSYGIHKDDYVLLFDGLNSFDFCSLGQQKMSYLSLLFAYIELFRYKFMSFPIVLIDDVSGELDSFRWRRLVEYLEKSKFQVLITTANEKFKEELEMIHGVNKVEVDSGKVSILN